MGNIGYCKGCGEEIEWREIYTRDGPRKHPFNVGTNTSHFKTCPNADDFRYKPIRYIKEKKGLDLFV
jgi:hypothetical protein